MDTQAEMLIQECINEQKEELRLSGCSLPSTVPLLERIKDCAHIKHINLAQAKVQHVVIKDLPHLRGLDLSNNAIEYVELSGLPELRMLYLGKNNLFAHITESEYYPKVKLIEEVVDLVRGYGVQSVYAQRLFQDFENSDLETRVKISPNPRLLSDPSLGRFIIQNFQPKLTRNAEVLAMLAKICKEGINLQNFGAGVKLDKLPRLRLLDLSYNHIKSLDFLPAAPKLEFLKLEHNAITDISPLKNFPKLKSLSLANNQIKDFTPLDSLKKLNIKQV